MQVIAVDQNIRIIRFDLEDEVLSVLKKYCAENNILAGHFTAIGGASEVELGWYDVSKKEYETKTYAGFWEIASVIGNVASSDNEIILHAHGVFSTPKQTVAAHIMKMTVGGTCEVALTVLPGKMKREYDNRIGLKLLN